VRQTQVADHRVEVLVREGQRLGVPLAERGLRKAVLGECDHGLGDVHPDGLRAALRRASRQVPRAAGDVEEADAGSGTDRVEQGSLRRLVRAGQ
jgi:hypothetical protein